LVLVIHLDFLGAVTRLGNVMRHQAHRLLNMITRKKMFIGALSLIVILGIGFFVWIQQPTQFTIAVTGQSGLAFAGYIKVDGDAVPVSGVVPANYVVTGRSVDCRFQKQQAGGALGVCLRMGRLNGTCSVTSPGLGRGVCAILSLHKGGCYTF
jgi:hypothetical protein